MLVIADASRAMAIAGVLGGRDSEVGESTTDVLLEVANFDARSVRRTRRALGISTDASHRFERGTDPAETVRAGSLAAALIASLGGGRVDGEPVLVGATAPPRPSVTVYPARLARLLGAPVDAGEIAARLGAIGFSVGPAAGDALRVTPPSWRHDVSRDVDLLEELARLRGYDTLPDSLAPFRPSAVPDHPLYSATQRVSRLLVGAGFAEVRPLPFVAGDDATHIRVTNPLTADEPHLRTSVLDSLAKRAEYNLARREGNLRLFEVGSAFARTGATGREECRVACLMMGARRPLHFTDPSPPAFDEWDAKAMAGTLANAAFPGAAVELREGAHGALWTIAVGGSDAGTVRRVALDAPPWASPAFGVELVLGELSVAPVAPPGSRAYASPGATRTTAAVRYRALPPMPAAEFDLALLVPDGVRAGQVEQVLWRAAGELLERLSLFDQFQGTGVPEGHRSLAWRLTFRHPERTLNDKEIAGRRQKIIATLEKELRVVPRSS
jgi:phenylalanyl-tRNA synthetase beta chain